MSGKRGRPRKQTQPPPPPPLQPESPNSRMNRIEQIMREGFETIKTLLEQHLGDNASSTTPKQAPPPPLPRASSASPVTQLSVQTETDDRNISRMKDFLEMHPPEFKGVKDPVKAEEWLIDLERIFEYLGYTDSERVIMAAYMLTGHAGMWWRATKTYLIARHSEISWEIFLSAFKNQYVPPTFQKKMQVEFLDLVQGNMTVDEYENKFLTLMQYDPETVRDEKHRAERFLSGLRPSIRDRLLGHHITEYDDALKRAREIEMGLEITQAQYGFQGKLKNRGKRVETSRSESGMSQPKRLWIGESPPRVDRSMIPVITTVTTRSHQMTTKSCKEGDKLHSRPCYWRTGACFRCGDRGHLIKDCPQLQTPQFWDQPQSER